MEQLCVSKLLIGHIIVINCTFALNYTLVGSADHTTNLTGLYQIGDKPKYFGFTWALKEIPTKLTARICEPQQQNCAIAPINVHKVWGEVNNQYYGSYTVSITAEYKDGTIGKSDTKEVNLSKWVIITCLRLLYFIYTLFQCVIT